MLEAKVADITLNITENGGKCALFYNQHITYNDIA
jgi:hypothetical protein